MKSEINKHLPILIAIFLLISLYWLTNHVAYYEFIFLLLGLAFGSFFLDLDHLIYWLYLNPNIEESRLARAAFKKYDFRSLIKLLEVTHSKHTNLIFHHFFFQVVLALISVFVFTSSGNVFTMAFILAINIHLLVDEIYDFRHDRKHLQEWLFARESKQLPLRYLGHYLAVFTFLSFVFTWLLLQSRT